jgi:hypothetical protein
MALKSNFNAAKSAYEVQEQANKLYVKMINSFIRAGEDFVTNAREQMQSHAMGQYEDVTANLRNSVGYFIFHNGKMIIGAKPGDKVGKKPEGKLSSTEIESIGKEAIKEFIRTDGIQLIGLAGMNYASYVESKGYNVISYQADICIIDLSTYLERLELIEKGTGARMEGTFNYE